MFKQAGVGSSRNFRLKLALAVLLVVVVAFLTFKWLDTAEIETPPESWLLGPDNWPVTVDETVRDILPRIPRFEKLRIRLMKKKDTIDLHFGLGLWIRNRYGLWRGNEKLIVSACGFRCQPDDASGKIIDAVWDALQK